MALSLKAQITLAIRVLLEGHRPQAWGDEDWARIDTLRLKNAWLADDNIVGAAVGFGIRGYEKTATLVMKIYVVNKLAESDLSLEQRIPCFLDLPQPIGEIEVDVIESGQPELCSTGVHNGVWPSNTGTLGAVLRQQSPQSPPRAVVVSNAHVFGYRERGLLPSHVIELEQSGRTVGRDVFTRGFRYANGNAYLRADVATAKAERNAVPQNTPGVNPRIHKFGRRPPIGAALYWRGRTSTSIQRALVEDNYFTVKWPAGTYSGVNKRTILPSQMILNGVSYGGDSGSAFLRKNSDGEVVLYGLLVGKFAHGKIVACPVSQFAQSYYLQPL